MAELKATSSTDVATTLKEAGGSLDLRFHHVGVAVKSMDESLSYYTGLFGFRQVGEPVHVPSEGVLVCFVEAQPGVRIELVEGVAEDSQVRNIAERFPGGPYHICYTVADIDTAITTLRKQRCRPIRRFDMPGMGRFAFLLSPDRQLFELCEPQCEE